jgi:hypothetical protein
MDIFGAAEVEPIDPFWRIFERISLHKYGIQVSPYVENHAINFLEFLKQVLLCKQLFPIDLTIKAESNTVELPKLS